MAAARTKKALNATDIKHDAEMWARKRRSIAVLEKARDEDPEIAAMVARHEAELKPLLDKYDVEIEKLESKAGEIYTRIIDWLKKRPKSIVIDTKHAVAEFFKGQEESRTRTADAQKFVAKCKERNVDPWPAMSVLIKDGEKLLGKKDFDALCKKEKTNVERATLTLKD